MAWTAFERILSTSRMSANSKVKVVWKTNCEWRDHYHWPKRKEIKLREGESVDNLLPLQSGEAIKVKFSSRWYDAEVVEEWKPKQKKGMNFKDSVFNQQNGRDFLLFCFVRGKARV